MKRSAPLRRSPMPDRYEPFPRAFWKRSRPRTSAFEIELAIMRPSVLEDGCGVCGGPSDEVHHRKRRSQGGDNSRANLMAVCHFHHQAIGRYPALAHQAGYSVLRHEDPRRVPVIPMVALPTAVRLRFVRPAYDWKALQMAIADQGPDFDA